MSDIKKLTELVLKFRDQRNWKQFHTPKDMFLSLTLEATELLEQSQWKNNQEILDDLKTNPDKISDELADVFYWVLLIANDLDIDLEKSLKEKLKKNNQKYPIETSKGSKSKYTDKK